MTRFLLPVVVISIEFVFAVTAAQAVSRQTLFERLFDRPDDLHLNMEFGKQAEVDGHFRQALAAYERAYRANPNSRQALRAFERMRARLMPTRTTLFAHGGISFHSNVRKAPRAAGRINDGTGDAVVSLVDERSVGSQRWRTIGFAGGRLHAERSELSEFAFGAWSGPVWAMSGSSDVHLAFGGAMDYVDGTRFFSDVSVKVTYRTRVEGVLQSITATLAKRDTSEEADRFDDGVFAKVEANLRKFGTLKAGDAIFFMPQILYSRTGIDHLANYADGPGTPDDLLSVGGRLAYYYPIVGQQIFVGAGLSVFYRDYGVSVVDESLKREDLYIESTAHLVFLEALGKNVDFRIDYRFEANNSTDSSEDYRNHVVGPRIVGRF